MFSMQEYEKIKKNMVSGMTIDLLHLMLHALMLNPSVGKDIISEMKLWSI